VPISGAASSTRYSWYVVAVLTLANVSGFVDRQILSLLVIPIKRDLGLSDSQVSYLIGLSFSVFYTLLGLPIAWLADRANRRSIIAVGVALWSVFTTLCATAGSYGRLLTFRIGVGVGEATLAAPAVSLIADFFPREKRGRAMSVYSLGVFLGSGLAYVIGGAIVGVLDAPGVRHWPIVGDIRPWQSVFLFVGAPGILVALLMLTIKEPARAVPPGKADAASIRALWAHIGQHRRTFLTHSLGFAISASVNYGIAAWLATFLIRTHGWEASRAGLVQGTLTMTVGVAGALAGGWVADALVRRGKLDGPIRVGMIGAAGMLVSATAYPLMPTAAASVAWLVVVNFFAAFPWGAATAAAAEIVPPAMRAQGAAVYFFILNLVAATLGPTAVAWCTDFVFHDEQSIRYSLALVNIIGMSIVLALFSIGLPAYRKTINHLIPSSLLPPPSSQAHPLQSLSRQPLEDRSMEPNDFSTGNLPDANEGSASYGNPGNTTGSQGFGGTSPSGAPSDASAGIGSTTGSSAGGFHGEGLADRAKGALGGARDKLSDVGSSVRERAGYAKDSVANVLEAGAERLRARGQAGDLAGAGAGAGAAGAGSLSVQGDGRMGHVSDRVAGGMQATAEFIRDADVEALKSGIERQVKEHPARTLLIAVGLGYLIGKAFRK
jgi:MFS family permease